MPLPAYAFWSYCCAMSVEGRSLRLKEGTVNTYALWCHVCHERWRKESKSSIFGRFPSSILNNSTNERNKSLFWISPTTQQQCGSMLFTKAGHVCQSFHWFRFLLGLWFCSLSSVGLLGLSTKKKWHSKDREWKLGRILLIHRLSICTWIGYVTTYSPYALRCLPIDPTGKACTLVSVSFETLTKCGPSIYDYSNVFLAYHMKKDMQWWQWSG